MRPIRLVSTLALLWMATASAPEAHARLADDALLDVFPAEVWTELGDRVVDNLTATDVAALAAICTADDADAILACVFEQPGTRQILENALARAAGVAPAAPAATEAPQYPAEALALLPKEMLDELPGLITKFLRAEEYAALRQACPHDDPTQVIACIEADLTLLERLHARAVIASLVESMDVELPARLTDEDYAALAEACNADGEAWATCVFEHGTEAEACYEVEEKLADCLAKSDRVGEVYLGIQAEKKAVFGAELYVEFTGLMAVLPIEAIKALRADCPQEAQAAAAECFATHPAVSEIIATYYQLSEQVVKEAAADMGAAGAELDVEAYSERVTTLFLTMPIRAIMAIAARCAKLHPELEDPKSPEDFDRALACIDEESQTDSISNPAYISQQQLDEWVGLARAKVTGILAAKERAAQNKSLRRILLVLAIVAVVGFIAVLLMPLFLARRYPGQRGMLWKSSAAAAVTFAVTIAVLGASLALMRTAQGVVATSSTSPKMRIAEGAFDVLEKQSTAETFSELSKLRLDFIKEPLRNVIKQIKAKEGEVDQDAFVAYLAYHWANMLEQPELKRMAENTEMLRSHAKSFKSAAALMKYLDWLLGIIPLVLSIVTVLLYLLPLQKTLVDIATAPARAAAGIARGSSARAMLLAEIKSVVPFLGIILVLLPLTGVFLSIAVVPLVELLLSYAVVMVLYLIQADASAAVLYLSLGAAMLTLVSCLAVYILAMSFFIGTARKALRSIFHYGETFASFKRLWIWGSASVLLLLVYPVAFVLLLEYVLFDVLGPEGLSGGQLLRLPIAALVGFWALFWAARGFKALGYLKKYPADVLKLAPARRR